MHPPPEWALLPSEKRLLAKRKIKHGDDSDSDYSDNEGDEVQLKDGDRLDLLKSTLGILDKQKSASVLSPDSLAMTRMKDANIMAPSKVSDRKEPSIVRA